jgi:tRNA (cmo5U34)-methyltransferase
LSGQQWTEDDSSLFADLGETFTPDRVEIADVVVRHIPAATDETFQAVDLCCGAGWLSEAILTAYPNARVLALDASPEMLRRTDARLAPFAGRANTRQFDLAARDWLDTIDRPVRCFASSLAIHHLTDPGKHALFQQLHEVLEPGGAFIYVDLIEPASEIGRRYAAYAWDKHVQTASQARTGSDRAWRTFSDLEWNWFSYPDPMDMPSRVTDILRWLTTAGFTGVDVPWVRAGHAIFAAYRPLDERTALVGQHASASRGEPAPT